MEGDDAAAALDHVVTAFGTYEEYLDSQVTTQDLYYLEVSAGVPLPPPRGRRSRRGRGGGLWAWGEGRGVLVCLESPEICSQDRLVSNLYPKHLVCDKYRLVRLKIKYWSVLLQPSRLKMILTLKHLQ